MKQRFKEDGNIEREFLFGNKASLGPSYHRMFVDSSETTSFEKKSGTCGKEGKKIGIDCVYEI